MTVYFNRQGHLRTIGDGAQLCQFHTEIKPRPTDRRLYEVIAAERALNTLWLITDCAEISDIGKERMRDAMRALQAALEMQCSGIDGERGLAIAQVPGLDHGAV